MPVRRRKEWSGCIAWGKVPFRASVDPGSANGSRATLRHYWHVYLWDSAESMRSCGLPRDEDHSRATALCCHENSSIIFGDAGERFKPREKLSELHFVAGDWSIEVVVHEIQHAVVNWLRHCEFVGLHPTPRLVIDQEKDPVIGQSWEEVFAYVTSDAVTSVLLWLLDVDPGASRDALRVAQVECRGHESSHKWRRKWAPR